MLFYTPYPPLTETIDYYVINDNLMMFEKDEKNEYPHFNEQTLLLGGLGYYYNYKNLTNENCIDTSRNELQISESTIMYSSHIYCHVDNTEFLEIVKKILPTVPNSAMTFFVMYLFILN